MKAGQSLAPPAAGAGRKMAGVVAARIGAAFPDRKTAALGALAWGTTMGASAWLSVLLDAWEDPGRIAEVVVLFGLGGALAFPVALYMARLIALGRTAETAFAAALLSLSLTTVAVTSALYALQYRGYYAQWHADTLSITWVFQFVFTSLSSLYQFAVLGVRMYVPLGFAALILASLWFARQPR